MTIKKHLAFIKDPMLVFFYFPLFKDFFHYEQFVDSFFLTGIWFMFPLAATKRTPLYKQSK